MNKTCRDINRGDDLWQHIYFNSLPYNKILDWYKLKA